MDHFYLSHNQIKADYISQTFIIFSQVMMVCVVVCVCVAACRQNGELEN